LKIYFYLILRQTGSDILHLLNFLRIINRKGGADMAQATFSVRMDESLKRQFDALCADFGMSATTAFNVFARAVVRERKIPFEIQASEEVTRASGMQAFLALRDEAKKNGIQDMTLDEINEEIQQARYGGV
jgi:addiction module RelB/DinJ family antitoxin